jgi:hypothetical protein
MEAAPDFGCTEVVAQTGVYEVITCGHKWFWRAVGVTDTTRRQSLNGVGVVRSAMLASDRGNLTRQFSAKRKRR